MNKQYPILLIAILALLATTSFSNAQAQQRSEEQLTQILKRFPEAPADKAGKLTAEFPGANHAAANAAVFSSVELVDWMLGFSKGE
ncbi:MAG: hypothetical protein VYC82_05995 [Verrucomicrobiota bacterium]|nr:hypothetical protein [Verrucomicrobiota bacterium]